MIRYEVDAVVDRSGRIGAHVDIGAEGAISLDKQDRPDKTIRRSGFIVPGFHDAHVHLGSISAATTGTSLEGASTLDDIARMLTLHGSGDVVAVGFDESSLDERRLLTAHDLDEMITDRAVVVYRRCGHIAMANSVALDRSGVDVGTADPVGGSIDRDRSGRPTGILRETAIDLVTARISDGLRDVGTDELLETARRLAALGLDSVTAMVPAGAPAWCGPDDELEKLLSIQQALPLRVDAVLIATDVAHLEQHARRFSGTELRFAGWKGFADGSLGGHTAALSAPYADTPVQTGTVRHEPEAFRALSEKAIELGGASCIHAIGDAAVEMVLQVFEQLIDDGAPPDRLRIEHASVLNPPLIARIAETGVVASVQPQFIESDAHMIETRVGPDRAPWVYPFRSMIDAGVRMIGGSDAPVEHPDPLAGVRAAVERRGANDEERLDAVDALALFSTTGFERGATWVSSDLRQFERLG